MSLICPHPWMMVWTLNSRWILLFFSTLKALFHSQVVFRVLIVKSDAILNLHYHVFPVLVKKFLKTLGSLSLAFCGFISPCVFSSSYTHAFPWICVGFFQSGNSESCILWLFIFIYLIIFLVISLWGYMCYVVNLYWFSGFLSAMFSIFYQFFFDLLSERFPQLYLPNFYWF